MDGLLDGPEVNGFTIATYLGQTFHTDPLDDDTDNDGLKDKQEKDGFSVNDPDNFFNPNLFYTDPTDADF